ncbi:cation channel sperm-associated auxiliary subunit epsilon isoform X2 [Tympanuchus pallidicinctus]|uniref:cation channel sperm-associated auxiliary subunit epsilon isoform X2 n=1 Tax=Tympanuchus pallidicinctus TaxID=109042 RepID=UPI0022873B26|nr:cation channel sperm-associated auxiliary subunit epsilon isoform X2 [Tympanuchus pallidicinctus]
MLLWDSRERSRERKKSSQILSKMLQIWRQKPVVQTYFKQKTYYSERLPKSGLWVADIPEIPDDIIIKITGVFQECFVQRTSFVVPRPKQSFPSKENDISLCSLQSSELPIKWSACFPMTAVLLSNFGTFYTNDAFRTHIEIKILSDILTKGLNSNITVVALSDNGISFLINSTCYKRDARHVFEVGAEHKLPESEILGMHSRYWCSSVYPVQSGKQLSTWAAGMSTELYVGYNEAFNKIADTASLVKIVSFPNTASLTVTTVSCDSVPCKVTMSLICNACSSSRLFFLAFYNEGRQLWGLGDFCLPVPHSSAMRMIYINSALSSGMLWDDVFATPVKTAWIMDIFLYLDQHYQKCLMGALSTRLFSEFTFSHQTDNILESNYTQALELTSGVMSAELKPRAAENACELQHQVSHFFVGCPPGRHIAVKIYDGDICVRNVEANFVLWEIKGRTDNGYTSSTKKNYRSCFELENSSKEGLNEQYQILNSTSQNHMARPFSHDATYVFRVRILTRNYRSDVSMAKFYSFITLSTLLVCATFCYRYSLTWKSETLGRRPKGQYLTDTLTK